MCYQVVELYSVCRCIYYKHAIDSCTAYGRRGHSIIEKTVLVGYACSSHSAKQSDEQKHTKDIREGHADVPRMVRSPNKRTKPSKKGATTGLSARVQKTPSSRPRRPLASDSSQAHLPGSDLPRNMALADNNLAAPLEADIILTTQTGAWAPSSAPDIHARLAGVGFDLPLDESPSSPQLELAPAMVHQTSPSAYPPRLSASSPKVASRRFVRGNRGIFNESFDSSRRFNKLSRTLNYTVSEDNTKDDNAHCRTRFKALGCKVAVLACGNPEREGSRLNATKARLKVRHKS